MSHHHRVVNGRNNDQGNLSRQTRRLEKQKERRASGLCVYCGDKSLEGTYMCQRHKDYAEGRRKSKKLNQKCSRCPDDALPRRAFCNKCLEKTRDEQKIVRAKRREAKVCLFCGQGHVEGKSTYCDSCKKKARERGRDRTAKRIAEDVCTTCVVEKPLEFTRLCYFCYFKQTSTGFFGTKAEGESLRAIFESQNERCPYSGIKLMLGFNSSLDHKIPYTKNGQTSLDNLQWVDKMVNQMKWSYTEEEFLEMVRSIASHRLGMK